MSDLAAELNAALADRYALRRELSRGSMATVFLAEDLKHHRPVAIKVLNREVGASLGAERFLREIEVAARLQHPHILPLLDSGQAGGLLYYVMPYVDGESLRTRLERERQLPVKEALRLAGEVAGALDYAHRHGVIHRDVKPENVLLQDGQAVVADFGIARAAAAAGGSRLTATGVTLGTPLYMSPEQALGSDDLDGRSDLYSLGCVFYEMLTGQPPFTGATAESVVHQHVNVEPRAASALRSTVATAVQRVLDAALAKAPADRFATAAEFAAAIAAAATVPAGPGAEAPGPRAEDAMARVRGRTATLSGRRKFAIAATLSATLVALLAVAAGQQWGWLSHGPGGAGGTQPSAKDWVLVAEFDGPTDDSTLAVATRDLVSAALDQSEVVATVPRDQIRVALELAGKPANSRVDAELARELAYRSAMRAVVEGRIERLARGFSVVVRVVDAESSRVVLTETALAKDEDALIPALGRLAQRMSAGLGERRGAIQPTRPAYVAATPSFEAYRIAVEAGHRLSANEPQDAARLYREALALDPDFAAAWKSLAVALYNAEKVDSALAALDEALRRPRRLTRTQRLNAEADGAAWDGDPEGALALYERTLQYEPGNRSALLNSAECLSQLGLFEEALERRRAVERASPFGPNRIMRMNELRNLICLGRAEEARSVARSIPGAQGATARFEVEAGAGNWAAAESIAVALEADPGLRERNRGWGPLRLGSARAARGALRAAAADFERAEAVGPTRQTARRCRLMLAVVSEGAIPLPPDDWAGDSSTANLLTRGLRAAVAGESLQARRLLASAQACSRRELAWQGAAPALLEAHTAALAGRWEDVTFMLRAIASRPKEIGPVRYPAGMSAIRWLLADAFERLGQPDSAAVCLERVATDPGSAVQDGLRPIVRPFAHRRLVLLYARVGRLEEAERHWEAFAATVRTPDPEIQPLIAEARAALAGADGMARASGK